MEQDKQIGRLIGSYFVVTLSYNIFRRILLLSSMTCMVFLGMLLMGLVVYNYRIIISFFQRKPASMFVYVLVMLLVYCISYTNGGARIQTIITYISYSLLLCLPFFLAGTMINNKQNVYNELKRISYWILLIGILVIFSRSGDEYNMVFSYRMLLPLLIFTNEFINNKKFLDLFLAFVVFGLIIIYGSRGAVLCFALFCILRFFLCKNNILLKIFFIIIAGLMFFYYNSIGQIIIRLLDKYGIQSRTLRLFFTNLTYISGRDNIQEKTLTLLNQHKWWGLGAASDIDLMGYYPHNIFLEILYDYGYVFGCIVIIALMILLIYFLRQQHRDISLLFLSLGFFPLFVSGTYLKEPLFWLLIGTIIGQMKLKKKCRQVTYGK